MTLRRRRAAPAPVEVPDELLDAVLASARAPRDEDEDRLIDALPSALARLAEGQRRCVELFYLEGLSYAEVAGRAGYASNEVKSHIQNGKRNLKKFLAPGTG